MHEAEGKECDMRVTVGHDSDKQVTEGHDSGMHETREYDHDVHEAEGYGFDMPLTEGRDSEMYICSISSSTVYGSIMYFINRRTSRTPIVLYKKSIRILTEDQYGDKPLANVNFKGTVA